MLKAASHNDSKVESKLLGKQYFVDRMHYTITTLDVRSDDIDHTIIGIGDFCATC